jgi:phosphomannomutase
MKNIKINKGIFKAYDIRGVYPKDLNEDVAYRIGLAFAELLRKELNKEEITIVLSCDMRTSTPTLRDKLIEGILNGGVNVNDIGMNTTPTYYFAVAYGKYDGGVQVTASHNPKEYNGFKLVRAKAVPVSGENGIMEICDKVASGKLKESEKRGQLSKEKSFTEKATKITKEVLNIDTSKIKPFKIVVDTGNALAIEDIKVMFRDLPIELIKLNEKLDGTFPNHLADPLIPENLVQCKKEIKRSQADLGIVTDGDGDRYFFIDSEGEEIRQEILRGIMAQIAIKENPGATICYDIRPGKITRDMIEEAGGKPIVTRVGHSLIKEQMIEVDAVFAGESSGHYYYKFSFGYFDSPIALTLKFLIWLSEQNKPLAEAIRPYKKYYHSGEINYEVKDKEGKIKELAEEYKDAKDISWLDGITIEFEDFWFNVRPSNTEQLLRLNLEAVSREIMEEKRDEVSKIIRS